MDAAVGGGRRGGGVDGRIAAVPTALSALRQARVVDSARAWVGDWGRRPPVRVTTRLTRHCAPLRRTYITPAAAAQRHWAAFMGSAAFMTKAT